MATYKQRIAHLEDYIQESLIREAPHTTFIRTPDEFEFLRYGIVDLGFENLGLSKEETQAIYQGFVGTGVRIPGTRYKMRAGHSMRAVIDLVEPDENIPTLPEGWQEALYVLDPNSDKLLYVGKRVRPDQIQGLQLPE